MKIALPLIALLASLNTVAFAASEAPSPAPAPAPILKSNFGQIVSGQAHERNAARKKARNNPCLAGYPNEEKSETYGVHADDVATYSSARTGWLPAPCGVSM